MQDNIHISIIVPVYNTAPSLVRCIQSILSQQFHRLEIIIVDDGSTDTSSQIMEKFAKRDSRITIIQKRNSGVSDTRNIGLRYASGDLVTFVDSDDYIDTLYTNRMVSCYPYASIQGWIQETETGEQISATEFHGRTIKKVDISLAELLLTGELNCMCGKAFPLSIIQKNRIQFEKNINFGEDTAFTIDCLKHVDKVSIINALDYHYVIYKDHQTLSSLRKNQRDSIQRAKVGNTIILKKIAEYEKINSYRMLNARMRWIYDEALSQTKGINKAYLYISLSFADPLFVCNQIETLIYKVKRWIKTR